jgi:hypothetical protein
MALVATPGAANANSYLTLAEAETYFATRLTITEWEKAADQDALLIMATRVIDALLSPFKQYVACTDRCGAHYRIRPQWTGAPTDAVQALAWPRTGMFNRNGFAIASNVIPQALKDATAELAGQLAKADRTLDNDVAIQGITSVRAGSVAITFKDSIQTAVIPIAVWDLLVPSWMTDEIILPMMTAEFDVVS